MNALRHAQLTKQVNNAAKLPKTTKSLSFQKWFASVVVSASRNAHFQLLWSLIYQKVSKTNKFTDMVQIVSNFIDFQFQDLTKCWVLLVPTVLENLLPWEYSPEICNQIWVTLITHQTGKKFWSISEVRNFKFSSNKCSNKTWKPLSKFNTSIP